ncbi:phage major capsid protein [Clostridium sp. 19966]|uniref:phage major capsid protein n=1 Tax=Clostridium sp. 19966 TaxID=2768166 RepID=UPI0028DEA605|nr:phage major capsid protein [Clostridium sp. 19966]MDT8715548.1 phage major capsid protein [Clostridium sp. 19966]
MNKRDIKKLLREKRNTMRELIDKSQFTNSLEEVRNINSQTEQIRKEIESLEDQLDQIEESEESRSANPGTAEGVAAMPPIYGVNSKPQERGRKPAGQLNPIATYSMGNQVNTNSRSDDFMGDDKKIELYEQRGLDLKNKKSVSFDMREMAELRSITIASNPLVIPTQTSNTLNPAFNQVSSTIDLIHAVPLMGGEAYKKGFVVGYGEGDYTEENADYTDADPIMDYVTIGKAKVTAYCEMSEESVKLPNVDYQAEVANSINVAIRKKISKQILVGAGGENQIKGIFNSPANVIPVASDLSLSSIDADTLDKIVFGYGGDEDIEGGCYLILNKKDLAAFAAVRSTTGEKLYKITYDGNMGTISSADSYSVNFIINSVCPALSDTTTTAATYCMAYGKLLGYELPIFSPVDVQESRDYKFKSGQVCYKGSVFVGGSVAAYKGFTRIKKA